MKNNKKTEFKQRDFVFEYDEALGVPNFEIVLSSWSDDKITKEFTQMRGKNRIRVPLNIMTKDWLKNQMKITNLKIRMLEYDGLWGNGASDE